MTDEEWSKKWNLLISKGQKEKDKRTIYEFFVTHNINTKDMLKCSTMFLTQMKRDSNVKYKFYDACGMWVGQRKYWSKEDLEFLERIVNLYLKE